MTHVSIIGSGDMGRAQVVADGGGPVRTVGRGAAPTGDVVVLAVRYPAGGTISWTGGSGVVA